MHISCYVPMAHTGPIGTHTAKATVDRHLEFLLEFQGSKRLFDVTNINEICAMVEYELNCVTDIKRNFSLTEISLYNAYYFLYKNYCGEVDVAYTNCICCRMQII